MSSSFPKPLEWRQFQVVKRGNRPEEIEDRLAGDPLAGRFAVADGASESILADVWAETLVKSWVENPVLDPEQWLSWLAPFRKQWWNDAHSRTLPWAAEHRLADGAAATFLGLQLDPAGTWQAVAVGDACLFQVRRQKLLRAFPRESPDGFNNRPPLVGTLTVEQDYALVRIEGEWDFFDQFLLTSDAMAQWILAEAEAEDSSLAVVQRLLDLGQDTERLTAEMDGLRDTRRLKNDDVVLVAIPV